MSNANIKTVCQDWMNSVEEFNANRMPMMTFIEKTAEAENSLLEKKGTKVFAPLYAVVRVFKNKYRYDPVRTEKELLEGHGIGSFSLELEVSADTLLQNACNEGIVGLEDARSYARTIARKIDIRREEFGFAPH